MYQKNLEVVVISIFSDIGKNQCYARVVERTNIRTYSITPNNNHITVAMVDKKSKRKSNQEWKLKVTIFLKEMDGWMDVICEWILSIFVIRDFFLVFLRLPAFLSLFPLHSKRGLVLLLRWKWCLWEIFFILLLTLFLTHLSQWQRQNDFKSCYQIFSPSGSPYFPFLPNPVGNQPVKNLSSGGMIVEIRTILKYVNLYLVCIMCPRKTYTSFSLAGWNVVTMKVPYVRMRWKILYVELTHICVPCWTLG